MLIYKLRDMLHMMFIHIFQLKVNLIHFIYNANVIEKNTILN